MLLTINAFFSPQTCGNRPFFGFLRTLREMRTIPANLQRQLHRTAQEMEINAIAEAHKNATKKAKKYRQFS
ncbi:MAG: hypothetical protein DBX55_01725 [Verrucomicrobia bacterium]|nr:MAG: hypothetical protein DBX55_01725 [Verrucomicrobiota bacterium]